MKVAIYIRVSTEEQDESNQLDDCNTINVYGSPIIYRERQSAYKDKDREQFELLKNEIRKGEIKHLIVWDWDRLYRNRKKLKEFFSFCKIYKCLIHSYRQQFFEDLYKIPSPFDEIIMELVINLMGWLAEDESRKKSERVKIAYKNRKTKWGRKPIHTNKKKIVWELQNQGLSIRKIAKESGVSVGTVHKLTKENPLLKPPTNDEFDN